MDLIFIHDLVFSGTHGVHTREKQEQQRFSIDIEARADTRPAAASDRLADAVDYAPFREAIRTVIEQESYDLIERIAHRIAELVMVDDRIRGLTVRVRKLDLWGNGTPGVSIERVR